MEQSDKSFSDNAMQDPALFGEASSYKLYEQYRHINENKHLPANDLVRLFQQTQATYDQAILTSDDEIDKAYMIKMGNIIQQAWDSFCQVHNVSPELVNFSPTVSAELAMLNNVVTLNAGGNPDAEMVLRNLNKYEMDAAHKKQSQAEQELELMADESTINEQQRELYSPDEQVTLDDIDSGFDFK